MVTSTLPRWDGDSEPSFVLELGRALAPHYEVTLLAPHCRGAATVERLAGCEVRRFRYAPAAWEGLAYEGGILPKLRRQPWLWLLLPSFMVALVVAVARELRREPFALVHAHWLVPQGVAVRLARVLARRRVPMICTAHGADVYGLRGGAARVLQRWVAAGCARLGVVSEALGREVVARGIDPARLRRLSMGVAMPVAAAEQREPGLVAFAGRLVEKKGVDVLIEAFGRVATAAPGARLAIAGGGPELPRLRQLAAKLGLADRVEFRGPVAAARVLALFGRAAVAVMPSVTARDGDAEGLGLVMLEAMAAGCPVIVTDLPVVRDIVRPGENALVFPERDAAALAAALARLLEDPLLRARLADRARNDVEARYAWSVVAAQHVAAYDEALAGATP